MNHVSDMNFLDYLCFAPLKQRWRPVRIQKCWSPLAGSHEVDANAPLASSATDFFGLHGQEPSNEQGHLFEAFLNDLGLYAPSTMEWCHQGEHTTWVHPRGQRLCRDYILCDEEAFQCQASWVDTAHDSGFAHEDHWPINKEVACTHRIHGAAIYGNIYHQYTPVMIAYIPAPWILWGNQGCERWLFMGFHWMILSSSINQQGCLAAATFVKPWCSIWIYPLVNIEKTMERSTLFNRWNTSKLPFSIAYVCLRETNITNQYPNVKWCHSCHWWIPMIFPFNHHCSTDVCRSFP